MTTRSAAEEAVPPCFDADPAEAAFRALADATRRDILLLLLERDRSAGEIARCFPISRPAVAKHMLVLKRAGFLRERSLGVSRIYGLDRGALSAAEAWLGKFRA